MPRQSITFTPPNDAWLKSQVDSQEYSNKSDIVNDLIRKARGQQDHIEAIRAKLIKAEQSGFTHMNRDEILKKSKEELRKNGKL